MPHALAAGAEPSSLQIRHIQASFQPGAQRPPASPELRAKGGLSLMSFPCGYKLATHRFSPFYRSALLIYWKFTIWKCSHIN